MKHAKRILSLLLVLALTAAAAMSLMSCDKKDAEAAFATDEVTKTITVTVIDDEGKEAVFSITTRAVYLRGALEQEDLVEGDESEYGLYVKVVNGVRADYDTDGAWWGFYKDGVMLPTGIDSTEIAEGDSYQIKYEKA